MFHLSPQSVPRPPPPISSMIPCRSLTSTATTPLTTFNPLLSIASASTATYQTCFDKYSHVSNKLLQSNGRKGGLSGGKGGL
jgi:hypothetical protein